MSSFEELGLSPLVVEALAAEGIEIPTDLQEHAIPVLRRGTSAVLRGGAGSGLLVGYGAALLDRIDPEGNQPRIVVLTPTRSEASGIASSVARIGRSTGHRVAALEAPWALPENAHVLVSALSDLDRAIRSARVKLDEVEALVITQGSFLLEEAGAVSVRSILEAIGNAEVQIAVASDPVTSDVRQFVESHVRRAVFLPPEAAGEEAGLAPIERGALQVHTVEGETEPLVAHVVERLLSGGLSHVLTFVRSEDAAADLGDALTLRGFLAAAPGSADAPVWLAVDPLPVREMRDGVDPASVAAVSVDVPADADALDRRHGAWKGGAVALARPRELPHLRRIAGEAGYTLDFSAESDVPEISDVQRFEEQVEAALDRADLGAYLALLERLIERHGAARIAAALAALVRGSSGVRAETPRQEGGAAPLPQQDVGTRPPARVKLFMSVGERDGVRAGDLLGAITGETGVSGDQVGRIEVRDAYSRVEVDDAVAQTIIRRLNGTSIRGRSVRVDFDRSDSRRSPSGATGRRSTGARGRRDEPKSGGKRS